MKLFIEQLKPTIQTVFEHLHQHPEVSWKEYQTTAYIKQLLEEEGFNVQTFDDCTGLVVEIGSGNFCIGLRTDIDALWQEVDGQFKANHSCGHDSHMTMTIGAMLLLKKLNPQINGRIKFVFQPAEEKGTGALKLIEKHVVDDVDFLYGVHLRPIQELRDGEAAGAIYHGAAKFLEGEIIGEDAHGARPHLGQNAIEIGASLIQEMKSIHLDPMVPHTVKMTKFLAGGDTGNLIPGKASFSIDLRAQTNEVMDKLTEKVEKIADALANLYGVDIRLETKANVAAAQVNEEALSYMEKAIIESIGAEQLRKPIVSSGGEDFHFYTLKNPHLKATMLGLGCDLQPGLHHPQMTFNHDAIYAGIEILARTLLHTFAAYERGE
ncbi:M20 peptidase aminoacylase family protein [Peribacillus asahii]|uniref:Amidohydrolase n=1 Tax=Peribacillus asahii TaxID=228899 RepID=A0A3Q9RMA6_9BACI|nr:M20 peptidase aminoacylase family protein [Peribacillus asahii]AZV42461.1 amidohydrolase [Peribacillus asahii]USK86752.1 M20 peptidase aminoacylase family protein [Peribacillus asahii]